MRVQAQSKHELDRKGSEQHVVGRPEKEKDVADHALLWPHALLRLLSFVLRAAHTVLVRPLLFVVGRSPFCFLHQVFRQRVVTDAFCLRSHRDEAWTRSISQKCTKS